jgi:hypothetical protein
MSICPCDGFVHPVTAYNQPGLESVRYRAGDFRSFRRALLQPLVGEKALSNWRPTLRGDLALQILEWWAYVADVLTFYNERSLNANLLHTAPLDADVRGLVRILGYRPRPGIGGSAIVAALLSGPRPIVLPAGFRIQSKPGPGQQPQTFETTRPFTLSQPDVVPARPPGRLAGSGSQLYLEGTVTSIAAGDVLVFAPLGSFTGAVLVVVQSVTHARDSSGTAYTEIVPSGTPVLSAADAAGFRLLRNGRASGLWKYTTSTNLVLSPLELEGVERSIGAGQVVAMTSPSLGRSLLNVTGTTEQIWYTNGNGSSPPAAPTIPAGAPHTQVGWSASGVDTTAWNAAASTVRVLFDWRPAGTLRNAPAAVYDGSSPTLIALGGHQFRVGASSTVMIEDANGDGAVATASVAASTPAQLAMQSFAVTPPPALRTPLRVLHNVIELTRGKTVDAERVGTGDASVPFQEFVLQKSPLTYLSAGDSYKSTLELFVAGIRWTEVPSFYQQPPSAQVYITFEDHEQKTHIKGGDGVNGAPFPTGAALVAKYRVESGLEAPDVGALTTIVKPFPGLRAVRSAVRPGGGADPDPPHQIRRFAPRSVLTFGRAISPGDYEAIAAGAPSVTRVRAYYEWNAAEQRASVALYVGDTAAAVTAARNALLASADPNRSVDVVLATAVPAGMLIAVRVLPGRDVTAVADAVRSALADPDRGLFGERRTAIGQSIYISQISAAAMGVPGVEAVAGLFVLLSRPDPQTGSPIGQLPRLNTGPGEYLVMSPANVFVVPQASASV